MKRRFTSADFFAGIGGMRLAFEDAGFKTVFSNEIEDFACKTYEANFGESPKGDITKLKSSDVPNHDVFVGGFPCQSFSIAGRKLGFDDTRGTLFFEIAMILKDKKPQAFLLENVKNLKTHDNGKTFRVITNTLEKDLGYRVFAEVLNAKSFGLPQNRERIIIVGFRKDLGIYNFEFPRTNGKTKKLSEILDRDVSLKYFISQIRYEGMKRHKQRHESRGHGFGYRILDPNGVAGAIVLGGMGRERDLVIDRKSFEKLKKEEGFEKKNKDAIRYLTPKEYAKLQGFSDSFRVPVSDAQAYRQFANSVPIPMVRAVAERLRSVLENPEKFKKSSLYHWANH
jgi:DNA (cytosine-5)-methyltransferase 1